ncbi:MAG: hypothetical protein H7Y37_19025 [Anaerolineae bacterium]|nr:hypothetical protein [Gloeobacterales cyanobacterium ES-bin-313]
MTSHKPMLTPDDAAFDERLERTLPRLLTNHPYNFQQDLEDFCAEEADLDDEIDRIWEQVAIEEIPMVVIEKPRPARSKPWIGMLAASLVVGIGITVFMTLGHTAPNAITLRSTQSAQGQEALAQTLQQQWKPKITARAQKNIILSVKVEAGAPQKVGLQLLQSSGDEAVDAETIKTASTSSFYKLPAQKTSSIYLLDFDLRTGKVSATQK